MEGANESALRSVASLSSSGQNLTGGHVPVFVVDLVSKARGIDDGQLHFDTAFLYHCGGKG